MPPRHLRKSSQSDGFGGDVGIFQAGASVEEHDAVFGFQKSGLQQVIVGDRGGGAFGREEDAFVEFREKSGRDLTDREGSFIAAEYLRERLEEEDERPLYDVPHEEVMRLIKMIGIK